MLTTMELILRELKNAQKPMSIALLSARLKSRSWRDLAEALARLEKLGRVEQGPPCPARTWKLKGS